MVFALAVVALAMLAERIERSREAGTTVFFSGTLRLRLRLRVRRRSPPLWRLVSALVSASASLGVQSALLLLLLDKVEDNPPTDEDDTLLPLPEGGEDCLFLEYG